VSGDTQAACRLYLVSPPALEPAGFADALAAALDAGDVACFLLALEGADDAMWRSACERLVPVARSRDVAFLLKDRLALVRETGADGSHIDGDPGDAREQLPEDAILGAGCGLSRHAAMIAGEAGADYVAFGPWGTECADHLTWWQAVMEPPCVAWPAPAADAAGAGADFVVPDTLFWPDPVAVQAQVREAAAAVAKAGTR